MRWTLVRQAANVLLMLGLLAALTGFTLARPALAAASDQPAPAAQGIDGLVPSPDGIRQGNQPRLNERYPLTAYSPFHVDAGSAFLNIFRTDPASQAANVLQSSFADTELGWLVAVVTVTSRLIEWSFSVDIVGGASGPIGQATQALAQQVYGPMLLLIVTGTALWLVWHMLIRRRALHALQGVSWMVGVMVVAGIYFASPAQAMQAINEGDSLIGQAVLSAISTGDPMLVARAGDPTLAQGDASSAELRAFADRLWQTDVFVPWSVAMFGDTLSGAKYGEPFLQARSKGQEYNLQGAPDSTLSWYNGANGGDRVAIMGVALGVALLSCLLYLAIAGLLIVSQFGLLVLFLILPLFLLVGAVPGWGRRLLLRWIDLFLMVLLLRVGGAAVLGIVLVLSGLIAQVPHWGVAAALQVGLVVTVWVGRKHFLGMFGQLAAPLTQPLAESRTAQGVTSAWQRAHTRWPQSIPAAPVLKRAAVAAVTGVKA